MQDLDFDEIDRAVNGVIEGAAPSVAPAPVMPAEPAQPVTPVSAEPSTAPAARRSAGRFMDVVHPSSDMRSRNMVTPRDAAPQVSVEPTPQPLDEEQPQTSPFLPDAKVEKRPLGGVAPAFAPFDAPEQAAAEPFAFPAQEQELIEAPDDPRIEAEAMPDPIDFAHQFNQPAPEESPVEEAPVAAEETLALEEQPLQEEPLEEPALDLTMVEPAPVVAQPVVEEQPIGPTSITQQYTEQASTASESGAIYDTESYHQPLAAPVKKKSGGLVILWIALLVLFGAGVGAAVYYFVLPML